MVYVIETKKGTVSTSNIEAEPKSCMTERGLDTMHCHARSDNVWLHDSEKDGSVKLAHSDQSYESKIKYKRETLEVMH